jgi:hypothetical protein
MMPGTKVLNLAHYFVGMEATFSMLNRQRKVSGPARRSTLESLDSLAQKEDADSAFFFQKKALPLDRQVFRLSSPRSFKNLKKGVGMTPDTVQYLGAEFGQRFFHKALESSKEAKAIYNEMVERGLQPQPERSHVFNVFSPQSLQSISISITPFSNKDVTQEGGLSVSSGGHAQGVIVDIKERTQIVGFTHFAVTGGKVVTAKHDVKELSRGRSSSELDERRIKEFAEKVGKVKAARPLIEIEAHQVRSLASIAYNSLLGDSFSKTVHNDAEVTALRGSTNIVAEIALFVHFRTSGSSCCSCSCSCWGSSSCSSSHG